MSELEIRKTQISDLPLILSMEQQKENAQYIIPNSHEEHTQLINEPDVDHLLLYSSQNGIIGFVILAGLTNKEGVIEFRRIVVQKKGRGYGRLAIRLIKEYCFKELSASRLWLDVLVTNTRARYLYKSERFKEEEILDKAIEKDGVFIDLVIMAIYESD